MRFCGCDLGTSSCPVALSQYSRNSLEGNVIFNMLFMVDDLFSAFLVKESIAKVMINF